MEFIHIWYAGKTISGLNYAQFKTRLFILSVLFVKKTVLINSVLLFIIDNM